MFEDMLLLGSEETIKMVKRRSKSEDNDSRKYDGIRCKIDWKGERVGKVAEDLTAMDLSLLASQPRAMETTPEQDF